MEPERHETYERIPWETLQRPRGDRQWLAIAISVALALGALAYSFMKNQAMSASPVVMPTAATAPLATIPAPVPATMSPVVVAEADLYAVDPERLIDEVVAHAEWFVVEYFSVDGSEESRLALESMLPAGVPLPTAPTGAQVFVDWVGVLSVGEIAPLRYRVEVAVRSMASSADEGFKRQPTRVAVIDIELGLDGKPRVAGVPMVSAAVMPARRPLELSAVPPDVAARLAGFGDVVGGMPLPDGRWQVVVMVTGSDGVTRPTTVVAP